MIICIDAVALVVVDSLDFVLRRLAAVVIEQSAQAFLALDVARVFLVLELWANDLTV